MYQNKMLNSSSSFCKQCLFLIIITALLVINISAQSTYKNTVQEWHAKRIENLKKENGWLNLAGLFWLEEGDNTIGAAKSNTIVFPANKAANFLGTITLHNGVVTAKLSNDALVLHEGNKVNNINLFPSEKAVILSHQTLRFFIIKRGDRYAIRLRDLASETLTSFKNINTYPINEQWNVQAKFEPTKGKKIPIVDVTGQTSLQTSPGKLVFTIEQKVYALDVLEEGNGLFILFGDNTNKQETYGSGRFLNANKPDSAGYTFIDFNKAYNPPCAFTPYATCPLPPKQNILPIAITAGEKRYGKH